MKRIVSLLLCTFMLVTLMVPFTGFAAETVANDYKLTYDARIDRCPEHTKETDPFPAGVGLVEEKGGLKITGANEWAGAVSVSVPTGVNDYTITFEMALDYTNFTQGQNIYYGFGEGYYHPNGQTGINDTNYYFPYDRDGYVHNVYNLNMNTSNHMFQLQNVWATHKADTDPAKLCDWMAAGKPLQYTFHVEGGKFVAISASAEIDGKTVTWRSNLEAGNQKTVTSFDKFSMATRVKDGANGRATITLYSVSVAYNGKTQTVTPYTRYVGSQEYVHGDLYNVRFVAGVGDYTKYEKLGFKVVAKNASGEELKNIHLNCKYVYNSLTSVSGDGSVSEETAAKYNAGTLMALAIEDIPMNLGEVHFLVTPTYTVNGVEGEGQTYEVVYNNGKLVSQTAVAAN